MGVVTDAAQLAWQVAANEAGKSGHSSIEPLHLLIGICSTGTFLEQDASKRAQVKVSALSVIRREWEDAGTILAVTGVDPVRLRREAREFLGRGDREGPSIVKVISRSDGSRRIFGRAEEIAQELRQTQISLVHLFIAILDSDEQSLSALMRRVGINVGDLRVAFMRAAVRRARPTRQAVPGPEGRQENAISRVSRVKELPRISCILDAELSPFDESAGEAAKAQRLALFYELPLQFGGEVELSSLLHKVIEKIVEVVPCAERAALLVRDRRTDSLLLQAHLPLGEPAVSLTLAERAMKAKQGFIWDRQGEDLSDSLAELRSEGGMYTPLLWRGQALGVICVDNCKEYSSFGEEDLRLLVAVAHHAAMAIASQQLQDDLRQKSTLMERLLTNFSPRIRERLLEKAAQGRLTLGGQKSEVTILFSDIRGFTRMSAGMDAGDVVELLNHYFSVLVETIFRYDGAIDKFIGDSILAVFGSPEADLRQNEKAVCAALEMQAAMTTLNQTRTTSRLPICDIGIGVHCGEVLHGFIGSSERMEFTVIGDTVNRAARYCAGAQPGEVLISAEMHQRVWRHVVAESCIVGTKHEGDLPAFRLKGFKPRD
jgi:adenylate cyclase